MSFLNEEQKNLVLDLYFGCGTAIDLDNARELIASNPEAAKLYDQLECQLDVLGNVREQPLKCPEHLAEKTIEKLKSVANQTENIKLTELLNAETAKTITVKKSIWRRVADLSAVAAALLIMAGVYFPTVNNMRYQSWLTACKSNMASIAGGIQSYANDNQDHLPTVSIKKDAPWWKVGHQGDENVSNTRHLWKLVQGNYVRAGNFVCPGRSGGRAVSLDSQNIENLKDFPHRKFVTYSSRLMGSNSNPRLISKRTIFISDANPIFEKLGIENPDSREFKIVKLCNRLKRANSRNHNRRGQNVMFTDGSVQFFKTRVIQLGGEDDIFTVKGRNNYSGCEQPSGESDVFLVP